MMMVELFVLLASPEKRRLGDLWADTTKTPIAKAGTECLWWFQTRTRPKTG